MQRSSRAIREGSVGLFALLGLIVFGGITIWLRGGGLGEPTYQFITTFRTVDGIQIGAPVIFRGVKVGKVVGLRPNSYNVDAIIEISSTNLQIPKQVTVQTNRYGLIGDAAIEIIPASNLSPEVAQIDPLSEDCDSNIIICQGDRLKGGNAPDVFTSTIELAELYSDPVFVDNLNRATKNAGLAAAKLARLTDDTSNVLKSTQKNINNLTKEFVIVTQSTNKTVTDASRFINNTDDIVAANRVKIGETVDETSQLVTNLNFLISTNRAKLNQTVDQINQTSAQLGQLAVNMNAIASKVDRSLDQTDTQNIVQNLQTLSANAAAASSNLRELSQNLNDPTTLVTLQQTLDSARVTFANTQKLTSDLDELLGDPQLRDNIRILINGLSTLVSSAENLDEQIRIAKTLEIAQQNLANSPTNHLEIEDFQPKRSYILPTQPKIILEKEDTQKIDSVKDKVNQ